MALLRRITELLAEALNFKGISLVLGLEAETRAHKLEPERRAADS